MFKLKQMYKDMATNSMNLFMENIGKPKYGIIDSNFSGVRIIAGIITGIRFTEEKPIYEISFGKDKWWSSEIAESPEEIFNALKLVSLNRIKDSHNLQIKYKI